MTASLSTSRELFYFLFLMLSVVSTEQECALCSTSSEGGSCHHYLPHCCAVIECQFLLQQLFDKSICLALHAIVCFILLGVLQKPPTRFQFMWLVTRMSGEGQLWPSVSGTRLPCGIYEYSTGRKRRGRHAHTQDAYEPDRPTVYTEHPHVRE
jgi:hypothetical protein